MSHLRPLREELFKYRKRKKLSINGSIPGAPYQRYRRSTTPRLGSRPHGSAGYHHEDYLGVIPTRYRPNIFSPAVDWTEYQQNQDEFIHIHRTPQIHNTLDRSLPEDPMPVASSDELTFTEQWLMNMGVVPRPQEGPIPVEFEDIRHLLEGVRASQHGLDSHFQTDSSQTIPLPKGNQGMFDFTGIEEPQLLPDLRQITETLWALEDRLPEDHPDIMNLRQAQLELGRQQLSELQQNPLFREQYEADDNWQSNLGSGNPYDNDELLSMQNVEKAEMSQEVELEPTLEESVMQYYQQQFVDETIGQPMAEESLMAEPMLEEIVEQSYDQLQFQGGISVVEQDYGSDLSSSIDNDGQPEMFMGLEVFDLNPALDEINQAMDQAAAFEQPEPDPWKQMNGPYQQMSMVMDMQMPYMPNPFEMPGPMGPGYGPMPGPMMGPM